MHKHKSTKIGRNRANRGDELWAILNEIADLDEWLGKAFKADPAIPDTIENSRDRLSIALTAVAGFINKVISADHGSRFFELSAALNDLNIGTRPPLLNASKRESRTLDPTSIWCQRAYVAVRVFDLKMKGRNGFGWREAAEQVAKDYPEIEQLCGKNAKGLATTIYNWHKEFSAGRIKKRDG